VISSSSSHRRSIPGRISERFASGSTATADVGAASRSAAGRAPPAIRFWMSAVRMARTTRGQDRECPPAMARHATPLSEVFRMAEGSIASKAALPRSRAVSSVGSLARQRAMISWSPVARARSGDSSLVDDRSRQLRDGGAVEGSLPRPSRRASRPAPRCRFASAAPPSRLPAAGSSGCRDHAAGREVGIPRSPFGLPGSVSRAESSTLTRPSGVTITFALLRSR